MTKEENTTIRATLEYCRKYMMNASEFDAIAQSIAILDAEDKPSVPLAMLIELAKHGSESYRKDDYYDRETDLDEIAARYGFAAKE